MKFNQSEVEMYFFNKDFSESYLVRINEREPYKALVKTPLDDGREFTNKKISNVIFEAIDKFYKENF